MNIPLPSRDELLAAVLLVERRGVAMTGKHKHGVVIYRYATEEDANNHLAVEAAAAMVRSP